jgi:16S rRNA (cytidine1402-2'-O)-methyltransferase
VAGNLYVVATPIGNRGDFSPRAQETLRQANWIACEDTRSFRSLTADLEGPFPPLVLYRDDNETHVAQSLLARLQAGEDGVILTDAGTPGVSDPGFRLVRACRKEGVPVLTVPGPSALTAFLSISGLPTDAFFFLGFLPPKSGKRQTLFERYREFPHTIVFYESVHRAFACAEDMLKVLGPDRVVGYGRELTKQHETAFTGKLGELVPHLTSRAQKGEFVFGIAPADFEL